MASGVSTILLPESPNGLCVRIKLLLQAKQVGKISNMIIEGITAIIDKLLEYRCISRKQDQQILIKCNLLHTKKK